MDLLNLFCVTGRSCRSPRLVLGVKFSLCLGFLDSHQTLGCICYFLGMFVLGGGGIKGSNAESEVLVGMKHYSG